MTPGMYVPVKCSWVIIGSDNGLSPVRRQSITLTYDDFILIGPSETSCGQIE